MAKTMITTMLVTSLSLYDKILRYAKSVCGSVLFHIAVKRVQPSITE